MTPRSGLVYRAISLLTVVSRAVLAQDGGDKVEFTYPTAEGLTFYQRDAVIVSYISNFKNTSLWTFCREGENEQDVVFKGKIEEAAPLNGSQEVKINYNTNSDNCWFNLRNNDEDSTGFNSVRFSISSDERSQTTLGLGQETTQTTAPPSTSETSTSTSSSQTVEPTRDGNSTNGDESSAAEPGDQGLSTGAKAGIGVGVALGVLGILAFVGVFFMLRRRKERNGPGSEHERQELHGTTVVENKLNWGGPPVDRGPPQEMSAGYEAERRAGAHEMPG